MVGTTGGLLAPVQADERATAQEVAQARAVLLGLDVAGPLSGAAQPAADRELQEAAELVAVLQQGRARLERLAAMLGEDDRECASLAPC